MEIPQGLKYSKEHEWVATEDSVATVGITDHAQDQLGEIVYIELPAVGDKISKDDPFGVVESVKAVSDIYAPVTGTVIEINEDLCSATDGLIDQTICATKIKPSAPLQLVRRQSQILDLLYVDWGCPSLEGMQWFASRSSGKTTQSPPACHLTLSKVR